MGAFVLITSKQASAQIIPDTTLGAESSVVTPNEAIRGLPSNRVNGGANRGANLFHSFQEFNIGEGRGVYFTNPPGVENILSRVTGANRSEILGRLGVLGNANLFLMNPNGIIFGQNARLDVEGSFVATTGNAIQFGNQGSFSVLADEAHSSLLTINPSALLFNQIAAAPITSSGSLQVSFGSSLLLVGGSITLNGGQITALDGRAELGGLAGSGTVGLTFNNNNFSLNFPSGVQRADVSLSRNVVVNVRNGGEGSISVNARNFNLVEGSSLQGGVALNIGDTKNRAGNIDINATETILLDDKSFIANDVQSGAFGNSGDVNIITKLLTVKNGAQLETLALGQGNSGSVTINASEQVLFDGGFANSGVDRGDKSGGINITTGTLFVTNGAQLFANTGGSGSSGSIRINAREGVLFENSSVSSSVNLNAQGSSGGIDITTGRLSVTDGAQLFASTQGTGSTGGIAINADDTVLFDESSVFSNVTNTGSSRGINIITRELAVTNGTQLFANTEGQGNTNGVVIDARNEVQIENGLIYSNVTNTGNSDGVGIKARSLFITGNSQLSTNTQGEERAGNVTINVLDTTLLQGKTSDEKPLVVLTTVTKEARGSGGVISIKTGSLFVRNGVQLIANTQGEGNAGDVIIDARDTVSFEGKNSSGTASAALTSVESGARGRGGSIKITTRSLSISDSALLQASTFAQQDAGSVQIEATGSVNLKNDALISAQSQGIGRAGNILINTRQTLNASNSNISTSAFQSSGGAIDIIAKDIRLSGDNDITTNVFNGIGGGGNITLNAESIIALDDSDILAFAQEGRGGDITFNTPAFFGQNYNLVPKSTDPRTLDGNNRVDINASGAVSGVISIPDTSFLQNSLNELPENPIDSSSLIASSCIARSSRQQEGSFTITGSGGLPDRPGEALMSVYAFRAVRTIPNAPPSTNSTRRPWQKGDPIVEPQGVYRLPSGQLVLSRECAD
ncbi:hypothetical protein NUACC21_29560 [Scytonema sp. NUACC21]